MHSCGPKLQQGFFLAGAASKAAVRGEAKLQRKVFALASQLVRTYLTNEGGVVVDGFHQKA
ncbi:hypothetical protein [Paenibacillus nasutitermitis]|uniref:Uncharacterized protein n=1 Tax=Paenibacillus nasutitermitis TaxID=1652958 RepID=A0A916YKV3_9BACL|nr:hypothetical protein [Paenibacillus nasutitermitis]GGD50282.1 hypothetical protein GCM10010911_04820 [Paenibacillus nasutitermitis]